MRVGLFRKAVLDEHGTTRIDETLREIPGPSPGGILRLLDRCARLAAA